MLGNRAVHAKKFEEAVNLYGEAIDLAGDAALATYFSNRAIARSALGDWNGARDDAKKAIQCPGGSIKKPRVNGNQDAAQTNLRESGHVLLHSLVTLYVTAGPASLGLIHGF